MHEGTCIPGTLSMSPPVKVRPWANKGEKKKPLGSKYMHWKNRLNNRISCVTSVHLFHSTSLKFLPIFFQCVVISWKSHDLESFFFLTFCFITRWRENTKKQILFNSTFLRQVSPSKLYLMYSYFPIGEITVI